MVTLTIFYAADHLRIAGQGAQPFGRTVGGARSPGAAFCRVRRYHDLVTAPAFAGYYADLQAIEVKRSVAPLMNRLASEGFGVPGFVSAEGIPTAEKIPEMIKKILSASLP